MEGIPESFNIRPGTIDVGKDYEIKIAALLILRCINKVTIKNVWLVMNANKCGAFDDIILSFENASQKNITYLIQLKHTVKPTAIKRREFIIDQGNFYLSKYYDSIRDIKQEIEVENSLKSDLMKHLDRNRNSMVYILFTTRGSSEGDYLINVSKTSEAESAWLVHECINTNGEIFTFNYENLNFKIENEYKEWMDNFFLFTKQVNINKVDVMIQGCIENLIRPVKLSKPAMDEVYQKFMLFVSQWSKGDLGGFYPITKTVILKALFECLIKPYMWKLEMGKPSDNICDDSFGRISNSAITVIQSDAVVIKFLTNHIRKNIEDYSEVNENKIQWKRHPEIISKAILRATGRYKNITMEAAYEFLWKTRKLSLIVEAFNNEDYRSILQLLTVFHGIVEVILLVGSIENINENVNVCASLKDLSKSDRIFILNYPITLQSRQHIKLATFLQPEHYYMITIRDVIYILTDQFNIGNLAPSIPEIFIQPSLHPILIKSKILKEIKGSKFIIYYTLLDDVTLLLGKVGLSLKNHEVLMWDANQENVNEQHRIILVSYLREVSKIISMCSGFSTHVLMLHDRSGLEWINTYGIHQNFASYRKVKTQGELSNNGALSTLGTLLKVEFGEVNIISAYPGMGKSTMLAYIANTASTDKWVVSVNLIDHLDYYKRKGNPSEPITHFAKHTISNALAQVVFSFYIQSKNVALLLDGFDEISLNVHKKVVNVIHECKKLGCTIFLTTRTNMQAFLEESFQTLSRLITPFSYQDQFEFLRKYFTKSCKNGTDVLIHNFTDHLLKAASCNLNDYDKKFTGVPLQTKLLCEVFKGDCENYMRNKTFENKHFDLIYLYKHFIREKIKIVCEKFGRGSDDTVHHYKTYRTLYALQSVFQKEDLESLNVEEKINQVMLLFPDTLHQLQKDGIVTIVDKADVRFVHKTFAEYLVAKWLAKNVKEDNKDIAESLLKKIFDPNFTTVRNMFDRLMAKKNPLHVAVINRQVDTIKSILNHNRDAVTVLDEGDRSVFHLVAGWGIYHPFREMSNNELMLLDEMITKDTMADILNLLGNVQCSKDSLYEYTPIDYAIASGCLNLADALCAQLEFTDTCITLPHLDSSYLSFHLNLFSYEFLKSVVRKHTITTKLNNLDVCVSCDFPLYTAIINGDAVKVLAQLELDEKSGMSNSYSINPLHLGAIYGQPQIVEVLLEKGACINASDTSGKTPLHWASIKCHSNTVSVLLRNSADPNLPDEDGMTALHYLSLINNKHNDKIITMLLENNADIEKKDNHGESALHYAFHFNKQILTEQFLNVDTFSFNVLTANSFGATILHWASAKGDEDVVERLLELKVNVDIFDADGKTPLHWACQKGHLKILRRLISNGANLNAADKFGRSPLYIAVDSNKPEVVDFLLNKNVLVTQKDTNGRTALYQAIAKNYEIIVTKLLDNAKDVSVRDNEELSVMHWAAWTGRGNIIKILLSRNVNCRSHDKYGRIPIMCAAQYGHTSVVQYLLNASDAKALDENNMNSLHWSCWNGHLDIVQILLPYIPNVNLKDNQGRTALSCCCHNGHANIAYLLMVHNADVNAVDNKSMTPLNWAAHNGYYETVKLLLRRNCTLEVKSYLGRTALANAASKGHEKIVKLLLANSFPMEIRDSEGMTALHTAAVYGHLNVIKILADKGADLEAVSNYYKTALIYSANYGQAPIVNYLVKLKVALDVVDEENMAAVTWAAHDGHNDIVALLVNGGACIEIPNKHGRTPLLCAVHNNHFDVVNTLLLKGANLMSVDNEGTYCIHQAAYNGNMAIFELLQEKFPVDTKDVCNRTPLIHAAFNGHNEIVCKLLHKGAFVDAQDNEGMSALHWAAFHGHINTIDMLLLNGATANSRDTEGRTPLVYAIVNQHENIVSLLTKKTDLSLTSHKNVSSLHVVAGLGNCVIADILLKNGANVNEQRDDGTTPLMCASANGRAEMVQLLLSYNANRENRDSNNLTARDWAMAKNYKSVIDKFDEI